MGPCDSEVDYSPMLFASWPPIRLGGRDCKSDYSTLSWIGMIFCAGVGATLIYWAVVEWAFYIDSPPLGAAPRRVAAHDYPLHNAGALIALPAIQRTA